jgi:hypothetical protein
MEPGAPSEYSKHSEYLENPEAFKVFNRINIAVFTQFSGSFRLPPDNEFYRAEATEPESADEVARVVVEKCNDEDRMNLYEDQVLLDETAGIDTAGIPDHFDTVGTIIIKANGDKFKLLFEKSGTTIPLEYEKCEPAIRKLMDKLGEVVSSK